MVVPGWPQYYLGRKLQGSIFLWGYLTCLPLGMLYAGTNLGALLLGLAISLHASSVADLVIAHADDRESRVMYSIGCLSLIGLALYFPAFQLITRVAIPLRFIMDSPPFQAGDVVIYNPSAYRRTEPQLGDMVVYRLPNERINAPGRGHYVYDLRGQEIVGRLVAEPGQAITFEKGTLMVDDKPSPWSELFSGRFKEGYSTSMPPGSYFISTGFAQTPLNPIPDDLWLRFSTVPRERITGKVYFRTQPLSQIGFVR
jgi:signal peptidase I